MESFKTILSVLTVIATISASIPPKISYANTDITASVSGYVSTTNGAFKLASKDKTPLIYFDNKEDESVIRTIIDFTSDIEKVTGITPILEQSYLKKVEEFLSISNIDDNISNDIIKSLDIDTGIMIIEENTLTDKRGRGIVAVYDSNKHLKAVFLSSDIADNKKNFLQFDLNSLHNFDNLINLEIQCFLWEVDTDDNLTTIPLSKSFTNTTPTPTTSPTPEASEWDNSDIIIGTFGQSDVIDTLVSEGKIDVSDIEGKWESFKIQIVDNKLVIVGSDKRGTIYGMYDISEKIGVSPWYWWADVPIGHADEIYINLTSPYTEYEPSVKYRGIFLNDETSLKNWASKQGDNDFSQMYPRIYELLLRLKSNYIWPAMQEASPSFHKNPSNAENANKYGIVIGGSHCEMLTRNNATEIDEFSLRWEAENPSKPLYKKKLSVAATNECAYIWTDINPDTRTKVYNKQFLYDYWKEALEKYGSYDNILNIGMRGQHDDAWKPLNQETGATLNLTTDDGRQKAAQQLEEIMLMQRELIEEVLGVDASYVPQMFIPYKEIQEIYDNTNMNIPDDVTLMWTDDNYGYIRQLPTDSNSNRSGGAGIYYHLSYHGSPNSYLWLCTTPLAQIREEMVKAYDNNAKNVWVANVGDLKPSERQIEYFLDLAKNIDIKNIDLADYVAENAKRDFAMNNISAKEYGNIAINYDSLVFARKPEVFSANLMSMDYIDEAQQYVDKYADIVKRSEILYESLDNDRQTAFFEMLLYPIRSSYNVAKKYVSADKSNAYISERGAVANKYADMSDNAYQIMLNDTVMYNSMLNSKWDRIMDPFQDHWKPRFNGAGARLSTKLTTSRSTDIDYAQMDVWVSKLDFERYSTQQSYIDIYNTGGGSFEYKITSDNDWIDFNKTEDIVYSDDRIWFNINWNKTELGENNAIITVSQLVGENVISKKQFHISAINTEVILPEKTYIESDGYISMEAEHYSNIVENGDLNWQVEKDFGRSGDSIKAYPNLIRSVENPTKDNTAYIEYQIYFNSIGDFDVELYRIPTLNERGSVRVGVGIDNNTPKILTGTNKYDGGKENNTGSPVTSWGKGVMVNNEILKTTIHITQTGIHTLRVYNVDTGFIFDKIVITTGEKINSYFGATESYNSSYNDISTELPKPSITVDDGAESEFNPDILTISADIADNMLSQINFVKIADITDNATITAILYNPDGSMLGYETKDITLSEYDLKSLINVSLNLDTTGATSIGVIIYDYNLQIIAPQKIFELNTEISKPNNIIRFKSSLADFIGKHSMLTVTDSNGNLKYMTQEKISINSYKEIPMTDLSDEKYTICVSVDGTIIERIIYTTENVQPDNDGTESIIYSHDFATDIVDDTTVILNGSSYSADNQNLKIGNGKVNIIPSQPISGLQGQQICIISDIAYGKQSQKFMNYKIIGNDNKEILHSKMSPYNASGTKHSLIIGGEEQLADGKLPMLFASSNTAMSNGYTRYTTLIDFDNGNIKLTISNKNDTKEYNGIISNDITSINGIEFSSDYTDSSRNCYVDNISISTISEPQYGISVNVTDVDGTIIEDAEITITDSVYKTEVIPNEHGIYMLCEGVYEYSIKVNDEVKNESFEVYPAMETKDIIIQL